MTDKLQEIDRCIEEFSRVTPSKQYETNHADILKLLKEYREIVAFEKAKWIKMKDVLIGVHHVDGDKGEKP